MYKCFYDLKISYIFASEIKEYLGSGGDVKSPLFIQRNESRGYKEVGW